MKSLYPGLFTHAVLLSTIPYSCGYLLCIHWGTTAHGWWYSRLSDLAACGIQSQGFFTVSTLPNQTRYHKKRISLRFLKMNAFRDLAVKYVKNCSKIIKSQDLYCCLVGYTLYYFWILLWSISCSKVRETSIPCLSCIGGFDGKVCQGPFRRRFTEALRKLIFRRIMQDLYRTLQVPQARNFLVVQT